MIEKKLIKQSDLLKSIDNFKKPIVFTNGVFDILHKGHVQYLEAAKKIGSTLIVALNSDSSVRKLNKAPDRPFNKLEIRKSIIAALESVDYVTYFDEVNPLDLLQKLKPDIYIKGGDYKVEELKEAKLVKSWGGQAFAIPFLDGFSTTSLIKRIRLKPIKVKNIRRENHNLNKAIFLDRDGVINKDTGYISKFEDFIFLKSVFGALKIFAKAGYKLIMITNQSGIARGLFKEKDFLNICALMNATLAENDIFFDAIYYCPHYPNTKLKEFSYECSCRKPRTGMIRKAVKDLQIDLKKSIIIGDKITDMQAGLEAGIPKRYLIDNERRNYSENKLVTKSFESLWECANHHLTIIESQLPALD